MNVYMRQGVRITTAMRRDAVCICDALIEYGSEIEHDGGRWSVHLSASSASNLAAVLTALKLCLDGNAIAAVKVSIDGEVYAMEGMTT
jgi:hypothetical protein